jgi:hypothetical protein
VAASDVHRDVHRATAAIFRIESARLIAGLARIVRDVGLAEELAQDALVAALERWPDSGVPDNPGAWLMAKDSILFHRGAQPLFHRPRPDPSVGRNRRSRARGFSQGFSSAFLTRKVSRRMGSCA